MQKSNGKLPKTFSALVVTWRADKLIAWVASPSHLRMQKMQKVWKTKRKVGKVSSQMQKSYDANCRKPFGSFGFGYRTARQLPRRWISASD